jgi:hypothetical protein
MDLLSLLVLPMMTMLPAALRFILVELLLVMGSWLVVVGLEAMDWEVGCDEGFMERLERKPVSSKECVRTDTKWSESASEKDVNLISLSYVDISDPF